MHDHVKKTMKEGATDIKGLKAFFAEEMRILSHLQKEIVDESKVQKGAVLSEILNAAKEECFPVSRRSKRARKY